MHRLSGVAATPLVGALAQAGYKYEAGTAVKNASQLQPRHLLQVILRRARRPILCHLCGTSLPSIHTTLQCQERSYEVKELERKIAGALARVSIWANVHHRKLVAASTRDQTGENDHANGAKGAGAYRPTTGLSHAEISLRISSL